MSEIYLPTIILLYIFIYFLFIYTFFYLLTIILFIIISNIFTPSCIPLKVINVSDCVLSFTVKITNWYITSIFWFTFSLLLLSFCLGSTSNTTDKTFSFVFFSLTNGLTNCIRLKVKQTNKQTYIHTYIHTYIYTYIQWYSPTIHSHLTPIIIEWRSGGDYTCICTWESFHSTL